MSDIELKRTIAQMDKAYTDACMDKRMLEARIEELIARNAALSDRNAFLEAEQRSKVVEAEELLQAAERDLDRQDVEIAALKAANELVTREKSELSAMLDHTKSVYTEGVNDRNSSWAENRRLRDVIVHQAAQLAGCRE